MPSLCVALPSLAPGVTLRIRPTLCAVRHLDVLLSRRRAPHHRHTRRLPLPGVAVLTGTCTAPSARSSVRAQGDDSAASHTPRAAGTVRRTNAGEGLRRLGPTAARTQPLALRLLTPLRAMPALLSPTVHHPCARLPAPAPRCAGGLRSAPVVPVPARLLLRPLVVVQMHFPRATRALRHSQDGRPLVRVLLLRGRRAMQVAAPARAPTDPASRPLAIPQRLALGRTSTSSLISDSGRSFSSVLGGPPRRDRRSSTRATTLSSTSRSFSSLRPGSGRTCSS